MFCRKKKINPNLKIMAGDDDVSNRFKIMTLEIDF